MQNIVDTHLQEQKIKEKFKKELQEKDEMMIAQSRHAAMGEMMSMIAHQWRQPISTISMEANNVLMDIELQSIDPKTLKESMDGILFQVQELSKTIDDFRDFFKPDTEQSEGTIKTILRDALALIQKSLENNEIKLIIDIKEDIKLKTHTRSFMHVLINIINNAKEMLVEKQVHDKKIVIMLKRTEMCYYVSICDNAGGISPLDLDKIFEPYFTTKKQTNGTGLGLYMSKVIMEKHLLGSIKAYNMHDGACFELRIPYQENLGENER